MSLKAGRALPLLLVALALLLLASQVSAHFGLFHNYKGGPWIVLWVGILFVALLLYEWLGDTPLGHSILFTGLLTSLYPSVAYPHLEIDASGWQTLGLITIACFAFFLGRAELAKLPKLSKNSQKGFAASLLLLALLALVAFAALASAHDHPALFPKKNYTNPELALAGQPWYAVVLYWVWSTHDYIHWWFILLMLWTCYHFRFVGGRLLLRHPAKCGATFKDKGYGGERKLHAYHRYFWFANVLLIAIHWHEVLTGWSFGWDYTYTFQHQALGMIVEFSYVLFFTLWLLSCHVFKYLLNRPLCEGCPRRGAVQAAQTLSKANQLHGLFMGLALGSMLLLLLLEGHL